MQSPQPRFRKPPDILSHTPPSSLSGMERTVPSFQSFVKRTPTPDQHKPLPPPPPQEQEIVSPYLSRRRSSSVYSRTISQWASTPESWHSRDLAVADMFLQPTAYNLSTPQLIDKPPERLEQPLLQPRTYSPLLASPSPSPPTGRSPAPSPRPAFHQSPSPAEAPGPSVLLPPPPKPMTNWSPQHFETMSLNKAKATSRLKGATPLLPEELRAMSKARVRSPLRRSRSLEPIGSPNNFTGPPALFTFHQFSESETSSLRPPLTAKRLDGKDVFPVTPSHAHFGIPRVDRTQSNTSFGGKDAKYSPGPPLMAQPRKSSREKVVQALGMYDYEEPAYEARGRTRRRSTTGPRNIKYTHCMPPHGVPAAEEDELELSEAQRLAEEYHDLLNQQKLGLKTVDTEESEGAGADIRLVPQPLFHSLKASSKRPSMPYRASSRNSSAATPAIRDTRQDIRKKKRRSSLKEAMRMPSFPLKLSLTPTPTKRRSTSGSIPISPPISPDSNASSPHQSPTFAPHYQQPALRIETDPSRFDPSHRFPSTAHRISRNGGNASPQSAPSLISPRSPPPAVDDNPTIGHRRMASDDGSTVSSEKFFSRLFQRRNNDHPVPAMTTAGVKPIDGTSALATRSSPSDKSPKVSQWSPETPTPKTPRLVHSIAPSRPTDERGAALREGLTQGRAKSGLLARVQETRKESKANKRREELKKLIRVVPKSGVGPTPQREEPEGGREWL